MDPGRSFGRVRTQCCGRDLPDVLQHVPPVEDFNAAGKTDENHHPDPDGAIVDADDPFGFFDPAAVTLGPVVVGKGFGIPQTSPIGVFCQAQLTLCLLPCLTHRHSRDARHFDLFPALLA